MIMKHFSRRVLAICIFGVLLLILAGCTDSGESRAILKPAIAVAGETGSWSVVVTVEDEITTGGSIKIQWPNGWYNAALPEGKLKAMQFTDADGNHYLAVETTRKGVEIGLLIVRKGLDGQHDRYGRAVVLTLEEGRLNPGDEVTLHFNNTFAPVTSEEHDVAIGIDYDGSGSYQLLTNLPHIEVIGNIATKVRLLAPSQAQVGIPTTITVVALDQFENATQGYRGLVQLVSDDSTTTLPSDYRFTAEDKGAKKFAVTFNKAGVQRLKVKTDQYLAPHGIASNPIQVVDKQDGKKIYWGDLHSHTELSKDASGSATTAYRYARDVTALDFLAVTDHGAGDENRNEGYFWYGVTPEEWEHNRTLVEEFTVDGEFVGLLATEWSGRTRYGHHNVFYRGLEGAPLGEDGYTAVEEIWDLLDVGEAFTIPHHTGLSWPSGGSPDTDWRLHRNDALRPAIEIYSLWGAGEYFGNDMSYEYFFQRSFGSHKGPNYARDAWALGHYIGTVAGSDDHNAHPGQEHFGLTAVYADELTRTDIFDAILDRHTYATTGQRILLEFSINGEIMGEKTQLVAGNIPEITVKVNGTDVLDSVEVMKYDGEKWSAVFAESPQTIQLESKFVDAAFTGSSLYYVRVRQRNMVENRPVMAWSSPIWVADSVNPWWEVQE